MAYVSLFFAETFRWEYQFWFYLKVLSLPKIWLGNSIMKSTLKQFGPRGIILQNPEKRFAANKINQRSDGGFP